MIYEKQLCNTINCLWIYSKGKQKCCNSSDCKSCVPQIMITQKKCTAAFVKQPFSPLPSPACSCNLFSVHAIFPSFPGQRTLNRSCEQKELDSQIERTFEILGIRGALLLLLLMRSVLCSSGEMQTKLPDHHRFRALVREVTIPRLRTFNLNMPKRRSMRKGNAVWSHE